MKIEIINEHYNIYEKNCLDMQVEAMSFLEWRLKANKVNYQIADLLGELR